MCRLYFTVWTLIVLVESPPDTSVIDVSINNLFYIYLIKVKIKVKMIILEVLKVLKFCPLISWNQFNKYVFKFSK